MTKQAAKVEHEESNRMWASTSFVGVLIVIGLPLWWKTTEVYRVALPYDKIASFDPMSHVITSELVVMANDEPTAAEIAGLVEKAFENNGIIRLKVTKSVLPESLQHTLASVADELEAAEEAAGSCDLSDHSRFHLLQRKQLSQDTWLDADRLMFFRDAKAATTVVEALEQWVYQTRILAGARAQAGDAARRVRFPAAPAYSVLVHTHHNFQIEEDIEDYIGSFVDELSVLHNITLKSQSMYMLNFDFQAKEIKDTTERGRHFAVRHDRLPLLLTKLEERASSSVPQQPTINLALYAAPCHLAPLVIYDAQDKPNVSPIQAFMSPQWGGVVISNPSATDCSSGSHSPPTRLIMGAFIAQLRQLVGIVDTERIPGASLEPLRSVVPRRWEVDNLLRIRTLEQLTSAERTLQSLAQLLGEISNIVINDDVGASINEAVEAIEIASILLERGELPGAYQESRRASEAAETAFMEPSLLALLYFPDDQKYAIYIPLFLPIMFPVVLSLKNLFLWFRGKPIHKDKVE